MNEPTHLRHLLRAAQEGARRILVEGVPWLVYELPALPFDRRNTPSLVFESDNSVRRVRDFPDGWRSLSDDELAKLSWNS